MPQTWKLLIDKTFFEYETCNDLFVFKTNIYHNEKELELLQKKACKLFKFVFYNASTKLNFLPRSNKSSVHTSSPSLHHSLDITTSAAVSYDCSILRATGDSKAHYSKARVTER